MTYLCCSRAPVFMRTDFERSIPQAWLWCLKKNTKGENGDEYGWMVSCNALAGVYLYCCSLLDRIRTVQLWLINSMMIKAKGESSSAKVMGLCFRGSRNSGPALLSLVFWMAMGYRTMTVCHPLWPQVFVTIALGANLEGLWTLDVWGQAWFS